MGKDRKRITKVTIYNRIFLHYNQYWRKDELRSWADIVMLVS